MQGMNIENINAAYLQLSQNVGSVERSVRDYFSQPPTERPVTWNTHRLDVFTTTGTQRFEREVRSANDMMNTLEQNQQRIAAHAAESNIFPPNAVADLSGLQNQLQAVQSRIAQIASHPANIGSEHASNGLERLRTQLNQALSAQEALNRAADGLDISAANDAYNRLSEAVNSTAQYIRDNTDGQGRFHQTTQQETGIGNHLMNAMSSAIGSYITPQTLGNVVSLSDTMTQTRARLSLIVDDGGSIEALQNKIYASSQNARSSYLETAETIFKLGTQAPQVFRSNNELIAFTELLNKQFVNAGTSKQGMDSVMQQITQAMASGKLEGEGLNTILDNAAPIAQDIQRYLEDVMGVDASNIRELASEGIITADIIKNAMFYAANRINEKFENMLITFEQLWQSLKDTALMVFQPVLEKISDFANSDIFKNFAALAECAIFTVSNAVLVIFDLISNVGDFLYDNWSWISPIIYGAAAALIVYNAVMGIAWLTTLKDLAAKAAHAVASAAQTAALIALTAAQDGLNDAIRACPVTWIVIGIIAIITAIIVLVRYFDLFGAKSTSVFGTICGLVNIVLLLFWNLLLTVVNVFLGIVRAAYVCGENLYIVFHNAISGIKGFFFDLLSTALNVIAHICSALNWLPFIDFNFSGIVGKADEFAEKAAEAKADTGNILQR